MSSGTSARPGFEFVSPACGRCPLSTTRTQVVPGEGAPRPVAMFVGEAPGPDEDAQGRPFIGRAGQILRRAMREAGWREDEVWITNTVKCFPHDLEDGKRAIRAPTTVESDACRQHLSAEIRALDPKMIVAVGRTAAKVLVANQDVQLDRDHGSMMDSTVPGRKVFVTFHPSGLHYRRGRADQFLDDLRRARKLAAPTSIA